MKSKLTWISIMLIIIFLGIQYWVTLQEHLKQPSSDWSRAVSLFDEKSDYSLIQSVKNDTGYTVTLKDLRKQDVLYCENDLKTCSHDRTISEGATHKFTYNDQQNSYYIEDDQLVVMTSEGNKVIANASNFFIGENQIAYWNDDFQVVVLDKETFKEERSFQMDEPIKTGSIVDGHLLIITEDTQKRVLTGYLADVTPVPLFSFNVKASENLQSIQLFSPADGTFGMLLDIEVLAGGGRSKTISYAEFSNNVEQQLQFKKVSFKDAESGNRLDDVRFPYIADGNGANKIAFSASGFDSSGEYATRIYVGDFSDEGILAYAATKSGELYSRPHLVDDENVLFFSIDGKDKSLSYSSADPEKIATSNNVGEGDLKTALIKFVTLLMNGMVLLLVSFLWFIPALGITYGIQAVLRKMHKVTSEQSIFYLHAAVLFVAQVIIFTKVFHVEPFVGNIPFLNEVWQLILLLAICILISILPVLLIRKRVTEDNFNSSIMYLTFMNLVVLLIMTGPYFL